MCGFHGEVFIITYISNKCSYCLASKSVHLLRDDSDKHKFGAYNYLVFEAVKCKSFIGGLTTEVTRLGNEAGSGHAGRPVGFVSMCMRIEEV